MPEEEFKRYMSGEAIPHDPTKQYSCEGLRLMHKNLESLAELRSRQEKLMAEALQLQKDMVDFKKSFKNEIESVLARTPLTIKPRKVKVDLDADTVGTEHLPPPLLPQIVSEEAKETGGSATTDNGPGETASPESSSHVTDVNTATDLTAPADSQHSADRSADGISTTYQDAERDEQKNINSAENPTVVTTDSTSDNTTEARTEISSNKDSSPSE